MNKLAFGLLALGLISCAAEPPPKAKHAPLQPRRHHEFTVPWISAIGSVDWPEPAECARAVELIDAESECVGKACELGSALAEDYAATCAQTASGDVRGRLEVVSRRFDAELAKVPDECQRTLSRWLTSGCGSDAACEQHAQAWATRCAARLHSPLSVEFLEKAIERSSTEPRRVTLDLRDCPQYEAEVVEAASCGHPFQCEEALPKVDALLTRCGGETSTLSPTAAVAAWFIASRAGRPLGDVPLSPGEVEVTLPGLLQIEGRPLYVARLCGQGVTSLPDYLKQRQECTDGKLELFSVKKAQGKRTLHVVEVPFPEDGKVRRALPWLVLAGEDAARRQLAREALGARLRAELDASPGRVALLRILREALSSPEVELLGEGELAAVLARYQAPLAALAREVAAEKHKSLGARPAALVVFGLLNRARRLPFSDLDAEGKVDPGLRDGLERLPLAFITEEQKYQDALEPLARRVRAKLPTDRELAALVVARQTTDSLCANLREEARLANSALEACVLSDAGCTAEEFAKHVELLARTHAEFLAEAQKGRWVEATMGTSFGSDECSKGWLGGAP